MRCVLILFYFFVVANTHLHGSDGLDIIIIIVINIVSLFVSTLFRRHAVRLLQTKTTTDEVQKC